MSWFGVWCTLLICGRTHTVVKNNFDKLLLFMMSHIYFELFCLLGTWLVFLDKGGVLQLRTLYIWWWKIVCEWHNKIQYDSQIYNLKDRDPKNFTSPGAQGKIHIQDDKQEKSFDWNATSTESYSWREIHVVNQK